MKVQMLSTSVTFMLTWQLSALKLMCKWAPELETHSLCSRGDKCSMHMTTHQMYQSMYITRFLLVEANMKNVFANPPFYAVHLIKE